MAEPALKLAPQPDAAAAQGKRPSPGRRRGRLRLLLLVVVPAIVLVLGVGFYLAGGRYISTDNAYVGAEKVLITPDISGKVSRVRVREGQHVQAGAPLFEIDPQPFELLVALGQQAVDIKQHDVERKTALAAKQTSTQVDVDNANAALLTAELQLQLGRQQLSSTFNQLLENADLRAEEF